MHQHVYIELSPYYVDKSHKRIKTIMLDDAFEK